MKTIAKKLGINISDADVKHPNFDKEYAFKDVKKLIKYVLEEIGGMPEAGAVTAYYKNYEIELEANNEDIDSDTGSFFTMTVVDENNKEVAVCGNEDFTKFQKEVKAILAKL